MPRSSLIAVALLAGFGACSSASGPGALDSRANAGPCPVSGSIYDTSRIIVFDGNGQSFSNIRFTGEITDVRLFCRYVGSSPIQAQLEIDFAFGRGEAAAETRFTYPYFVAVTRRNAKVLGKERFVVEGVFRGAPVSSDTQVIRDIIIPRADEGVSGSNFEIVVGFELNEAQLAFNREGQRFQLGARAN